MARYGFREGQGLGKQEQGMSQALQVEKTSKRGGKIIHEKDIPKGYGVDIASITSCLIFVIRFCLFLLHLLDEFPFAPPPLPPMQTSGNSSGMTSHSQPASSADSITEAMKNTSKVVLLRV